ncbi:MAG: CooT family nickel-binding protein [Syntrophomonadaceae bacterium]
MCEANVFIYRGGREEMLMEKVDRVIPGEDDTILLESIFGERKIVKGRIREMELVHHRIILDEIREPVLNQESEIWLEPNTSHGHFHEGEEVILKLYKGYNMHPADKMEFSNPHAFVVSDGVTREVDIKDHHGAMTVNLGHENDGLVQVYVQEHGPVRLLAKIVMEVGHHHHHGLEPVGLPLEIIPCDFSHAHMGENYEVQVLKEGKPLSGVEVRVTYTSTKNRDYPHRLTTNEEGKARIFLTAKGNYLFSVSSDNTVSTFTLVKSF